MVATRHAPPPARSSGWRQILALRPAMVDFDRRGFRTTPAPTRAVLEAAAGAFLTGYNLVLAERPDAAPDLSGLPPRRRGFAAEGAAMAAVLLDALNPAGGRRFAALNAAYHAHYVHLMQVGAGWAMAKLRRRRLSHAGADEPLLRWLAYDGMGFCQAFFATERGMRRWRRHPGRCPDTCGIRYQGLGRSLWFRECADPAGLAARVSGLPERHHGDVWSGVALAASYAGGVEPGVYPRLREVAADHRAALAQGAAFAAEAWRRSGSTPPHAVVAVRELAGVEPARAAAWTASAKQGLDRPGAGPAQYRTWRLRIQRLAREWASP